MYITTSLFREIASAIKKLLDAVNEISGFIPGPNNKQVLEQRKREFVKFSKRFSNTLKDYFKEGQWVFIFQCIPNIYDILQIKGFFKNLSRLWSVTLKALFIK